MVTDDLTAAQWDARGRSIRADADRGLWELGDWLIVGVARGFTQAPTFDQAIEVTGYSRTHLSRALAQAETWPPEARVVSWSVLNQIRRLPDADRDLFVAQAVEQGWTVDVTEAHVSDRLTVLERQPAALGARTAASWRDPGRRRGGRVTPKTRERQVRCPHCGKWFTIPK